MKVRFLLDENLTPQLKAALWRYDEEIDVLRVGDEGAPPLAALDPDILRYLESTQRLLATDNRRSMPSHLADHTAAGGHHWGVFWIRPGAGIRPVVETLYLIWEASEAEEWVNHTGWIPF